MTTGNPRTNPTPKNNRPKRRSTRGQEFTNMICEVEGRQIFITSPRRRSLVILLMEEIRLANWLAVYPSIYQGLYLPGGWNRGFLLLQPLQPLHLRGFSRTPEVVNTYSTSSKCLSNVKSAWNRVNLKNDKKKSFTELNSTSFYRHIL